MANIIQSPFLVLIRLAWVTIPPTVTQSPSRRLATSASVLSHRARSAGPTSLSGWAEMNRPIASFSAASSSRAAELLAGDRGVARAPERLRRRG